MKILVVHNDDHILNNLTKTVSSFGEVEIASDGLDAYKKIQENSFEIIITGVVMPGINGFELYNKALTIYPDLKSRAIFLTPECNREHLAYLGQNNLKYLLLPYMENDLKKMIYKILDY